MTLQTSGTISLSNLQTEFSGVNPISLSEYYRGGSYVELSAPTVGIPASGLVSLSNYYGKADVPPFSAVLKWSGLITTDSTLDVSTYATTPYSTLVVVQLYLVGSETFYYPPTTKMNGVDMPLIKSQYSNAFDDGRAISISSVSVAAGGTYTLTWTSAGGVQMLMVQSMRFLVSGISLQLFMRLLPHKILLVTTGLLRLL